MKRADTFLDAEQRPKPFIAGERDGRAREVFPNLTAAEIIPGATHYLPARHHAYLNERCERFLKETV